MSYYINEIGNRYGKLVVIEKSSKRLKSRTDASWVCLCDCGNFSIVSGGLLRRNKTLSCGCSKLKDKSGNKYGKLLVISRDPYDSHKWVCKCDCGNIVSIAGNLLQKGGDKKSCGCISRKIEIPVGSIFGHLTVMGESAIRHAKSIQWTCRCECGKIIDVPSSTLRKGHKTKCGRECSKFGVAYGNAAFNLIYGGYVKGARRRKILFELSKDEFRNLTSQPCTYCGRRPSKTSSRDELNGDYVYNGIDRVNNSLGYISKNCVTCCWNCNRAKQILSETEFRNWIIDVYSHWASKPSLS